MRDFRRQRRIWIYFKKSRMFLKWTFFFFLVCYSCFSSSGAWSRLLVSLSSTFFLCCSVAQSCLILCNSMDCSMPCFPVLHYLLEFAQTRVLWVNDAIWASHPQSPPSPPALNLSQHQNFFPNEWTLCTRWPKYWIFSFSISPSNEYSGRIFFRIDCFDLLAVQGISRVFSSTTVWKH